MFIFQILAGVATATALGMLWFSKLMFGGIWMSLTNPGKECMDPKYKMWQIYTANLLLTILNVYVIHFILSNELSFGYALLVWAGFTIPLYVGDILWEGKALNIFLIKAGYGLVSFVLVFEVLSLMM